MILVEAGAITVEDLVSALAEQRQTRRRLGEILIDSGQITWLQLAEAIAERVLPLLEGAPERGFSEPNRWGTGELEEASVRPELVCEVRYDKVQGNRFRHGTRFLRFRDDKDPRQCTWREVRPARRAGDPTFESLLAAG